MKYELERRFLVDKEMFSDIIKSEKPEHCHIFQGYLNGIRIRREVRQGRSNLYFLTIKGPLIDGKCFEYEYEIPMTDGEGLLTECSSCILKARYDCWMFGRKWQVDCFGGDNEGLIIAEIEYKESQPVKYIPHFCLKEITGVKEYSNYSLSLHPYDQI